MAGRPAHTPRLDKIDARQLAGEAQQLAVDYLHSLALRLSPSNQIELPDLACSTLHHAVLVLATYAQHGSDLDAPVSEYLQSICEPLWIRPIDGAGYDTPDVDAAMHGDLDSLADDTRGRLVLVMVAAVAREQLDHGHALTVAQLAALSSRSCDHLRLLGREQQIRLVERDGDLRCTAAESRKLLKSLKS